jgi:pimeloyl-ACP methyl ester carboxylesterase
MSKPVIVIVPGAWHRPKHYQRINDGLQKFQYEAVGVTLPSVDSKPPLTSWDKDAKAAREVILKSLDAGKDVIVIAHSYGGVVMSEAVKGLGKKAREEQGLRAGVVRLIYMCAIAPQEGQSFQSQTKPVTDEELQLQQRQQQAIHIQEVWWLFCGKLT